jgi:hypothetical protein
LTAARVEAAGSAHDRDHVARPRTGRRDLTTTDPDGNVVIFTAARPAELTDPAFSGQMRRWSSEQGAAGR